MNKLDLMATLTLGCALALAGCDIQYSEGGNDWGDGVGGFDPGTDQCPGGSHGTGEGQWGDGCADASDCTPGLSCDDIAKLCVPDPNDPQPCTTDADCSKGLYCNVDLELCVPGGICTDDVDCPDGLICDVPTTTCVPDPGPVSCAEVAVEQQCIDRPDCEPVYAGVNCSCGPNCECTGGEPGCVCESFEYFKCDPSPAP